MIKSKKLSIFIFSLMLVLASFLFVACNGVDYSKTYLTANSTYIEIFKGDNTQQISITIENPVGNMSGKLIETNSNTYTCEIEETVVVGYTTTYKITGKHGGTSIITFTTEDGGIELDVTVKVREYSDTLSASSNSLYISSSKRLEPSSADFDFKDSATEKELEYYLYGQADKNSLSESDLNDATVKANKFTKATLVSIENKEYIIFENAGNLYTLGTYVSVAGTNNVKYAFLPVSIEGEDYVFDKAKATSVSAGQKFTFLAKYVGENPDDILFSEREFHVLVDINKNNFSHEYGYKLEGVNYVVGDALTSYKIDTVKNGDISLIPEYKTLILDQPLLAGRRAVYSTAYLEVTANSVNDLLKVEAKTADTTIANSRVLDEIVNGTTKTYYIEINCGTSKGLSTEYNISFYYEGFKNSDDENVNFTYSIPVEVKVIPTNLLVNNVAGDEEDNVYTFYNNYSSSTVGWQAFNFSVIPSGAQYDTLSIDLTNSDLQLRYRNSIYTSGIVEIANINETVYIKGLDGANVTAEPKSLSVLLEFNVISADKMISYIKYRIVKGATILDFKSADLKEEVYLEINGGGQTFNDLYADAEFSNMTFAFVSGSDVVRFEYDKETPYIMSGYEYKLNFKIIPLSCGTGSYTVMLDNGKMATLDITVLEALNSISVVSTNEDNTISLIEEVDDGENVSTLIYALNKDNKSYFDLQIVANGDVNSSAIRSVEPTSSSSIIELGNASINSQFFNVYLRQNGAGELNLAIEGYSVENFRRSSKEIDYVVSIVSYNLIDKMSVYKLKDGFGQYAENSIASYTNVYSNTSNDEVRSAKLEVGIKNEEGFLFENPALGVYDAESFDSKFVYWESDSGIYKSGVRVDKMTFTPGDVNVYTVGNYGTFDTSTMTFTAFANLQNAGSLRIVAHIRQYKVLYSYTINIKISIYEEVERVTLQSSVDQLEFSALERGHSLIAQPTNSTATNGDIVALFKGGTINVDGSTYSILDENSINYIESNGKTQINLVLSEKFLEKAENYQEKMQGDLVIVAKDWLDVAGNLNAEYQDLALHVTINFANGTEKNRFTINDADDLYSIKDNLSAHYQIKTTIDASSIVSKLPLGQLSGSIVGVNEYATITGLNITSNTTGDVGNESIKYYGLFSAIKENAYIEYVQFEGSFNLGTQTQNVSGFSNIGLIAGENYGKLINVGATISASNVYMTQGNFGGVVGANYGTIIQDFTLFEENSSTSRSETSLELSAQGRYSYQNLMPKTTVFMSDYANVNYVVGNGANAFVRIGGMAGLNSGVIQKIDSQKLNLIGYSNYTAYARIKSQPSNLQLLTNISRSYTGGLVGENIISKSGTTTVGGQIFAGFNAVDESSGIPKCTFTIYDEYKNTIMSNGQTIEIGNFKAGDGLIVGGDVWAYGYVGGVVGRSQILSSGKDFSGITSRTFIRGQKAGNTVASIAIIANIEAMQGNENLSNAFAIQAVDDGRTSEEASMVVLYNGGAVEAYKNDVNKLGFGNFNNLIDVLNGFKGAVSTENKPINVFTYVISRTQILMPEDEEENLYIQNIAKDAYYGEYVVVGIFEGSKLVVDQAFFTQGDKENLSLMPKFNNRMHSETGKNEIYYTYYYQVASADNDDLSGVQSIVDTYLNKITSANNFYPFVTNGEMVFTSRNADILTIDQMGKMTIKKTGLAQVSASSVLNSNDALNFYIYVVNYFNSEYSVKENDQRTSVVYPNLSSSAIAIDKTTIELRGENSATLYVRPTYSLDYEILSGDSVVNFLSDKLGNVIFRGVSFKLSSNDMITAKVVEPDGEQNLDIEIIGQVITIRKLAQTAEDEYKLIIMPRLQLKLENQSGYDIYYNDVNKVITDTVVEYKYGALYLTNKNYNNVPIHSSKKIVEEITIGSTDENEGAPKYHILGLDNRPLQGNVERLDYLLSQENQLFIISFIKGETKEVGLGRFEHSYILTIEINSNSSLYLDRYNQNIYGRYALYVEAESNAGKNILIQIDFEKTNVFSLVVDNYTSLDDATWDSGLSSSSKYAFPGESGLLAITITPEDSDFDYILIENDDQNYQEGNSSALLGILARKSEADGDSEMFESGNISGAITKKGIKLTLDELVEFYGRDGYVDYNGVIYLEYNMTSSNVIDGSVSKLNVKLVKDGQVIENGDVTKDLIIKLKNYVAVEIEGKEGIANQNGYYMSYEVARGLRYKLNINSYGFRLDEVTLVSSHPTLGTIVKANDEYYLEITSSTINYPNNEFELAISVSQTDGDITRTASSKTKIVVNEFVLNYNGEKIENADIVEGMGEGILDVQVGSQTTLAINLFDYIEYDQTNSEVVNKINDFFATMANKGNWTAYTNLVSLNQPNYNTATGENGLTIALGYVEGNIQSGSNYFFNYNGLDLLPVRTHTPEEKYYFITYEGYYGVQNGVYTFVNYTDGADHTASRVATTFVVNVYSLSSEESPIPVYDYDDLCDMQKGGYYILLNDITIPNTYGEDGISEFKPLSGNFASFDGNGHTINMAGTYNMGSLSNIGLFGTISEDTIVKNLNINYTSATDGSDVNTEAGDTTYGLYGLRTVKFVTSADSFMFGSVAAENEGIITNCFVKTDVVSGNEYYLSIKADNALTGTSYIGGLVGNNSGFITNSGVSINLKAPYNMGGVVAQNFNKISACYFKEGKIINNSQFDQHAAGFVLNNSDDAQIMSSYVAGAQTNTSLYSQDKNSFITSTLSAGGFIYENRGKIQDCYTDIDLSKTTSEMAGFAYRNAGTIKNAFSLSVLRNNVTASAGFVKENVIDGKTGEFSNCYYFYNQNSGSSADGFIVNGGNINTSLYDVTYEGVAKLNAGGFNQIETNFADYSYQETMGVNAVWFHSKGNSSNTFVNYIPTTEKIVIQGNDGNTQTNTVYKTELMSFGLNRLELISPNIKTLAVRNFSYSEIDQATGDVTYYYIDDANTPNRGTLHNPRLISNADNMESEIINQTSSTNMNIAYYRMISDIDYTESVGQSGLYKVIFAGMLEGNGMEISRIGLVSMDKLESAGMFAQIGYSASRKGVVKNLTITPREVAFNSTNSVGTLAGVLKYGEIYNIQVNAIQGSSSTVSGQNFVGGVVGRAVSSYIIKDVYSYANASASYSPTSDTSYNESKGIVSGFSYAGGIVGFAGKGVIYNAHVNNITSVMGSRAGFAYGGVGEGALISYTYVNITPNAQIKAYHYGGYVTGETSGNLDCSYVPHNGNIESTFAVIPKTAMAVGGIAGRLNGGVISNALVEQEFRVTSSNGENTINYVGGIAGIVSSGLNIASIKESKVTGSITASNILGGIVGQISSPLMIDLVAVSSSKLTVTGERANPYLGGIVGYISELGNASLTMTNSYCQADLDIKTSTSGVQSIAHVGGLIGASGKTPKLAYCYTTSIITAEVYDSRQTGALKDFGSYEGTENEAGYANFSHIIDGEVSKNSTQNYNNVYYLGSSTKGAVSGVSIDKSTYTTAKNSGFLSFSTKVKNTSVGLAVNNYGTSSLQYATNGGNASAGVNKSSFNNLYGDNMQLQNEDEVVDFLYKKQDDTYYLNQNPWDETLSSASFKEDANISGSFYYEKKLKASDNNLFMSTDADVNGFKISYYSSRDEFTYKVTNIDGERKRVFSGQRSGDFVFDEARGGFYNIDQKLDLSSITMRVTFDESKLVQNRLYKDSVGNYYQAGLGKYIVNDNIIIAKCYRNIETNEAYYLQGDRYMTITGELLVEIPTIDVWTTQTDGLSSLEFEKGFDWLNKI